MKGYLDTLLFQGYRKISGANGVVVLKKGRRKRVVPLVARNVSDLTVSEKAQMRRTAVELR